MPLPAKFVQITSSMDDGHIYIMALDQQGEIWYAYFSSSANPEPDSLVWKRVISLKIDE